MFFLLKRVYHKVNDLSRGKWRNFKKILSRKNFFENLSEENFYAESQRKFFEN